MALMTAALPGGQLVEFRDHPGRVLDAAIEQVHARQREARGDRLRIVRAQRFERRAARRRSLACRASWARPMRAAT